MSERKNRFFSDGGWREEVAALVHEPPPDGEVATIDPRFREAVERYEESLRIACEGRGAFEAKFRQLQVSSEDAIRVVCNARDQERERAEKAEERAEAAERERDEARDAREAEERAERAEAQLSDPGTHIAILSCPCCGEVLKIEHGDEAGDVVAVSTCGSALARASHSSPATGARGDGEG